MFLDLAKAFDTVDHAISCSKLKFYGFQGASYDLIHNYLSDRQQVLFNGNFSDWGTVSIGVPQGSILGPLLFALYTLMICVQLLIILSWICMLMTLNYILVTQT